MGGDPHRGRHHLVRHGETEFCPPVDIRSDAAGRYMTVRHAADLLAAARSGLALTGAGVSAESGIPTFRGEGGLWTRYDPVKVASIDTFLQDPGEYWRVAKDRGSVALAAR